MEPKDSKKFWENCDTTFAHITPNRWLKSKKEFVSGFSKKYFPIVCLCLNGF